MFVRRLLALTVVLVCSATVFAQVAGQNINMVSGTNWPAGDPYLQRQNEPSIAVSSRNPEHMLGGANDYRTVDIPNPNAPNILGDAWVGVYTSMDGGETFKSTLLPGFPQDTSAIGKASPLHAFTVATDPTVRAGTHGLFYYSGLVFNRGSSSPSGVFVATFQDNNNKGNGDAAYLQANANGTMHGNPFSYLSVKLVDTGTSGQFLDKPWIAVDIPRPGRTATCTLNGKTFSSGYVYVVYTQFNGSQNNPSSKIKVVTSTNCGSTWSQPQILSQSQKLAQGTVATVDPNNGNVYVAWRQIAMAGNQNQPDAIQYAYSTNGGASFVYTSPVYTFAAPTSSNPYIPGSVFDQPQASSTTFRTLDVPSLAVDNNGRVWLAFSQRFNGPTAGTYTSRIMIMTLPKGSTTWTAPYVADGSSASSTATKTYGHQFMPSLNFAYGKMMLAWFDSRRDNLQSVLQCPTGSNCTDLSQVSLVNVPIPGSTIANPATVFTPLISDPNSGVRHTIDVYGAVLDPSAGPAIFSPFQVSQYPFYVDDANNQIEQGFFNPPNLPMFVQGTTPFIGDYIDIAAQSIMPIGNTWSFNTQARDATGATNAPDFHLAWTDNRDVVAPPVVSGSQDWTQYVPPNGGNSQMSTYSGTGAACPTCSTTQPPCNLVNISDANGVISGQSSYSGDRNQNVYTSRISNGLVVRFRENTKLQPANTQAPPQRAYSLLVKNTVSPLSTTPVLGAPSYYRILLGETSTSQGTTGVCNTAAVPASFPGTPNCYLDITVNPKSTSTQAITVSTTTNPSINVLVAQISCIPGTTGCNAPSFKGLQALAVINADTTNPSVADPDFLNTDNDNPDVEAPYQNLPIAAGEEYFPTVDSPQDPENNIFTPKISVPAIFTPKIGTVANSAPAIETPTIFTPKITSIFTPKITSVQVANPTIVNTIFTPKIFTPKIFTPKIVNLDIFTPKISNLSDGTNNGVNPVTDYSWKVNNKGNTSASYSTSEFAKSAGVQCCPANCSANNSCPAGCSVCQLVQHKLYDSPTVNRDTTNLNPTCDLTVQENSITVANVPDPAFSTSNSTVGSASDPSSSSLSLSPGEGNRVTLRVIAPKLTQTVSSFKTQATPFANKQAGSLTIATSVLPVAVVGQSYTNTVMQSIGGFGTTYWTVPGDPANPAAVLPPPTPDTSESVTGTTGTPLPLTLSPSGQLSTSVITAAPGTYLASFQVQDSAVTGTVNPVSTPSLDVQQINVQVNQFSISSVVVSFPVNSSNEVGSTAYMKAGDVANVTVTVSSVGPANETNVTAGIQVNPTAAGTPSGPSPLVTCSSASPASAAFMGTGAQQFLFNCTAISGNGYVTFTASAQGHYVNAAADVLATAVPVTVLTVPPAPLAGMPSQVVVDTVPPTLTFATAMNAPTGHNPATNQDWYNVPVVVPYSTSDNLSGVAAVASPVTITGLDKTGKGTMTLSTEGTSITGTITVTDFAKNSSPFTSTTYNIDVTQPTISGAVPQGDQFGWYKAPVTVTFSCGDPNPASVPLAQHSGVASCTSPTTLSSEGANQSVQGFAKDYAGNPASATVNGINIDLTPPSASIASPASNGVYINNQPIPASYTCADALSGVYTCVGAAAPLVPPVPTGTNFTQTVPGPYSFAVTATDKALNQSIAAVNYSTAYYGFSGFQSPLAAPAGPTPANAPPATPTNSGSFVQGTTIPILWTLANPATNNTVIDPSTLTGLSAYPYNSSSCIGGIPTGNTPIQLLPASGLNSYAYDALNQRFQFLWNTASATPGCYYLLITFNDLSVYATNVVISPAATSTGLSLAGTSTVDGTNSNLPPSGSSVSMEAWVNPANSSNMDVFTYGQGLGLAIINQHVHLIGPTQDAEGSISIPIGQWTHIAVSYDGHTTATIYVNGAADVVTSLPSTGSSFAASNFAWRVGDVVGAAVPTQGFLGVIDEVKVWSATQSAAQIVSDMTNELCIGQSGLAAYYKFNQGTSGSQVPSGTLLPDVSSSQANGTINNSNPASPASWAQGAPALGNSLSIAVIPANAALSLTGSTTQQFSASGSCTDGSSPALSPLNWSVVPAGVVTIDSTGLATAVAAGNATVSAASADASGNATVTVGP